MTRPDLFGFDSSVTVITVILALCSFAASANVKVTVYYESLCPDSVRFIGRQLYPNWTEISPYVDLELVPYGKALHSIKNDQYEFFCQHGPAECKGNKYQSCLLNQNRGKDYNVPLVYCIMKSRDAGSLAVVKECAQKAGYDVDRFTACATSEEADELLAKHGDTTWQLVPNISFVPTIVFNDTFNKTASDQALIDFVAVLCDKMKTDETPKPAFCTGKVLPKTNAWDDLLEV